MRLGCSCFWGNGIKNGTTLVLRGFFWQSFPDFLNLLPITSGWGWMWSLLHYSLATRWGWMWSLLQNKELIVQTHNWTVYTSSVALRQPQLFSSLWMLIISHQLLSLVGRSTFLPGDNLNIGVCSDPSSLCEGSGSETKQPLSSLYHILYKKTKLRRSVGMRLLNNGSFLESTSTACMLILANTRHDYF